MLRTSRLEGSTFGDTLVGNNLNNVIFGAGGNDSINGSAGHDAIIPGAGNDTVAGGSGFDRIDFFDSPNSVIVNLNTGIATGFGTDDFTGIYDVGGTDFNDTITGDGLENFLYGFAGNDTIRGEANNDRLYGDWGDDVLDGGAGGLGTDTLNGGAGNDVCIDGENLSSCEETQAAEAAAEAGDRLNAVVAWLAARERISMLR